MHEKFQEGNFPITASYYYQNNNYPWGKILTYSVQRLVACVRRNGILSKSCPHTIRRPPKDVRQGPKVI